MIKRINVRKFYQLTYASQPVLLKVWNRTKRSLPSFSDSDNHNASSFVNSNIRSSNFLPKSNEITSFTEATNVTA